MGDWIPLLVRREDYPELASLVAEREAVRPDGPAGSVGTTAAAPTAAAALAAALAPEAARAPVAPALTPEEIAEAAQLAKHQSWDIAELERLATSPVLTAHRWKAAIDVCASQPGAFVPTERLAELIGVKPEEWNDAENGMRRHLLAHYPDAPGWPLVAARGADLGRDDDQLWWAITESQATRWTAIRDEQPQARRPRAPLPQPLPS
ncbi:hypothetical protein [Nocardioides stalactiti]|uniref:hypothetical protein n=1 Tax=Nocardioides stalactiti TaxID=2755356 RepID=UPI0015FF0B97|nr:hypothetical protein [Nocardioides stalactiti]